MAAGHDRITPEGKKFYAELAKLKELQVRVGYQAGEIKDDRGVDMAQIAMFNELGTSTAPARPFLRMSVDENESQISAMGRAQVKKLAQGATAEACLKEVGAYGVKLVQEKIGNGSFAPNAPSTIKKKGSDHPLIDTGHMRQSVKYVIKRKGEE